MLLLISIMANNCMDYSLENIFFRNNTFHVLNKIVGFIDLIILKIVNDKVQSSFRNNVNQGR
jgi:hypothetical protein